MKRRAQFKMGKTNFVSSAEWLAHPTTFGDVGLGILPNQMG